ncbi:MAG TPA: restriction endonuclease subunit S [Ktedonobacteraceae bacterium]|nr:restriction endonuclease subunit S [Ktedonobacteraceae bacterium]
MEMIEREPKKALQSPMMRQKWLVYGKYRDSGVEWLGEIPAHWKVQRIKYLFRVVNGATPRSSEPTYWDGDIPWTTPEDLGELAQKVITSSARMITLEGYRNCGTTLVPSGSFVLSTRAPIGHLAITGVDLCTNQGCRSLVPLSELERTYFFFQLFNAKQEMQSWGQGSTFLELGKTKLEEIQLFVPPYLEQRAIATFLDRETAKIDALIAKKEKLIALLQEKRAALISQAITRGLNPDAPMKDSGVEWLGMVPEHWNIAALKRVAKIRYGLGQPPEELLDGTPLLRATNVKKGKISKEGMMFVNPSDIPSGRDAVLSTGEIIVVRSGAYTGDSAIIPLEYNKSIIGYDLALTIVSANSSYIAWQLLSEEIYNLQFGFYRLRAAQSHLNAEEVGGIIITLPPLDEQQAIATHLDYETTKIDALISRIREAVEKVKEYRTALISAAVTGKIDVRGEMAGEEETRIEEGAAD